MDCVLCDQPVTNPLCQDCLAEAIEQWLHEEAPERVLGLRKLTESIRADNDVHCVHCSGSVGVCTYCYTRQVFNWLHDGKLQISFVDYFNFDFYDDKPYGGMRNGSRIRVH
jgi:hypothetical protein